jgi:hypothetical protein
MQTITNLEVKKYLKIGSNDTVTINTPDANYCMYSEDFILGEGYKNFKSWLFKRGIFGWRQTFDCDNYAEAFIVYLQILHTKAMQKEKDLSKKQSVAFGVIWFNRDKGGGHAINVFITKDNEGLVHIKYIEPQTGEIVYLSQTELKSIFFILI